MSSRSALDDSSLALLGQKTSGKRNIGSLLQVLTLTAAGYAGKAPPGFARHYRFTL
uniref:hypothetical protein n=1 Tax=Serratia proteamaculans TaxID=28151 RepID=UPI001F4C4E2F|nr:hypothetical protein [Serratia proteamaculans]